MNYIVPAREQIIFFRIVIPNLFRNLIIKLL